MLLYVLIGEVFFILLKNLLGIHLFLESFGEVFKGFAVLCKRCILFLQVLYLSGKLLILSNLILRQTGFFLYRFNLFLKIINKTNNAFFVSKILNLGLYLFNIFPR